MAQCSMAVTANLVETITVGDQLGECVLWRSSDRTVWWTDVQARRLHRLVWPSLTLTTFETPQRLCSFSFLEGTDTTLLAAFESGLAIYVPEENQTSWLHQPDTLGGSLRLNDGRTDPMGRFWVGSMSEDGLPSGKLYCTANNSLEVRRDNIHISNGICWAPGGRQMYFTDSPSREIQTSSFDPVTGTTGPWKSFAAVTAGEPDGAITDAHGNYWFAHWGAGRVAGLSPQGAEIGQIDIPTPNPTCPALGGPSGNLLFVTTATQGLDQSQLTESAGALYVFETGLQAHAGASVRARRPYRDMAK